MIKLTMEDRLREHVFFKERGEIYARRKAIHFPPGNFFSICIEQTQNSLRNSGQVTSSDNKARIIYLCNREQLSKN